MDDGKGTSQSQSKRAWYLDRKCDLSPRDAGSIQEPAPMRVRPEGTWSITARVRKAGEPVSLFTFTVLWPKSWAAKGYTRFTMGFESLSEAREWHGAVSSSINHLRERHHMKTKGSRQGSLAGRSAESVEGQSPPHTPAPSIANNVVVSAHPLTAIDTPSARFRSPPESVAGGAGPEPSRFASADAQSSIADFDDNFHDAEDGPSSSSDEDDDDRVGGPQRAASRDTKHRWSSVSARAVPYKQTNGVAIYHLDDPDKGGWGGEFMVTASIRGSPSDVLSVLMRGSSNTTILGPATVVESLECVKTDGGKETKQVVRLVLEAPGWTGWACAPRELVVEQMIKRDEGTYVLLFSSVDTVRACSLRCLLGGGPKASPPMSVQRSKMKTRSLYSTPVLGEVRGTYVISPLKGFKLDASPETLITCILKVDLGGACGDRAWVRPFADMLGWTDAFLDRILMSVILVRDVVEHSRFVLKPLSLLATTGAGPRPEDQESSTGRREGVTSRSGGSGDADDEAHLPPGVRSSSSRGKMFSRLSSGTVAAAAVAAQAVAAGKARHGVAPLHGAGAQPARKRGSSTVSLGPLNEEGVGAGDDPGEAEGSGGGYDGGGSVLDLAAIKAKCTLEAKYWDEIHAPGTDAPFRVRGPTYLKDRKKVPAGLTAFTFGAMDVVTMPHAVTHIARYLPSIRESRAPFAIIINLIIPGVPLLGIVGTFITDRHPDILGQPPKRPMEEDHDWEGFDFVLHRFLNGTPASRNLMLKLIPHIADGSWVIKQSVGTTPVITGKALKTTYHVTKQYIEVDIDVSANQVAAYVTGLVRGATKSLVIDMGFVLEGTAPWELPECLLGALRLNYLDIAKAVPLDMSREVPLLPASAVPAGTLHSRTSSLAQAQLAAFNPNEKLDPERFASMSTQPPQSGVHRRAAAAAATAAAATTQRDS